MIFQAVNIHNLFKGMARTFVCLWSKDRVHIMCLGLEGVLGDEARQMLSLVYYGPCTTW